MGRRREPAVAGTFYDAGEETLRRRVDGLVDQAVVPAISGSIRALVSPHAGYAYSGPTAAVGYKAIKGASFDPVIIVGPSHREFFGGISAYPGDSYSTPLGEVPVNEEITELLVRNNSIVRLSDSGHRGEHCLEVQLPFLQRVLDKFSIVPLIIGDQRRERCLALGEALAAALRGRHALLVASSDLSHYHSYEDAVRLDSRVIQRIEAFDEETLMTELEHEEVEACGGGPVVAVMRASRLMGADHSQALFYCNSGDITGDKSAVVGYLSAAILQSN